MSIAAYLEQLPTDKTPEHKNKRNQMFTQFDPNGNGYLSLAEVDKGLIETFGPGFPKPAIMRAFQAAKGVAKNGKKDRADDYVTKIEFRILLVYLKQYFELYQIFDSIDSSDDRRIDVDEFAAAVPQLNSWGMNISDPKATFNEIDDNGGGQILFVEFCDWAIAKGLADLHDDDQ